MSAKYLLAEDVADRYQQSLKWVHDRTRTNRIPYIRHAGMRRHVFNPTHLDAWDVGAALKVIERADGARFVLPEDQHEHPTEGDDLT